MSLSFTVINTARNALDAPISQDWGNDVVNDLNYLYGNSANTTDASGAPIIQNGSFEVDPNNSTTVTGWTVTLGTGSSPSTGVVTNSDQNHGGQSFKFTRDNTVGGNAGSLTSNFFNVSPSLSYQFGWMLKCSRSDVENTVQVAWYTATQSLISTTLLMDSGTSANAPTSWLAATNNTAPPTGAVFAKIILNAGVAGETPAATASIFWDGIFVQLQVPLSNLQNYSSGTYTFTVPAGVFWLDITTYDIWNGIRRAFFRVRPGDTLSVSVPPKNNIFKANATLVSYGTNYVGNAVAFNPSFFGGQTIGLNAVANYAVIIY